MYDVGFRYWKATTVKSTDGSTWRDKGVNGKQPQIVGGGQAETTNFPQNSEDWACLVIYPINIDLPKQNITHNYELIASDWRCFYFISAEILQQRVRKYLAARARGVPSLNPGPVRQNRRWARRPSLFLRASLLRRRRQAGGGVLNVFVRTPPPAPFAIRFDGQVRKRRRKENSSKLEETLR